jgi:membrane protein YqaA with SNARE-associated domain
MLKKLYHWMGQKIYSPYADVILGILFYIEAIFFFPTDPMLIFYCITRPNRAITYATIATIGSSLGGLTGYGIGYALWESVGEQIIHAPIVNYIMSPSTFYFLRQQYQTYEYWAVLIAGFTPIPYKAATLSAGFCKLSIIPFIICSALARGFRFYLFAFAIKWWGPSMKQYIDRYFNLLVILFIILVILGIWALKLNY